MGANCPSRCCVCTGSSKLRPDDAANFECNLDDSEKPVRDESFPAASWSDICCFAPTDPVEVPAGPLPSDTGAALAPSAIARTVSRTEVEEDAKPEADEALQRPPTKVHVSPQEEVVLVSELEKPALEHKRTGTQSVSVCSGTGVATSSRMVKALTAAFRNQDRRRYASGNSNLPSDYRWLEGTLQTLGRNQGGSLGCKDLTTGKHFFPLFFLIGSCPNYLCGMQVVMYCVSLDGEVDFWWVKPMKDSEGSLERNTLNRHGKGPHKNDPGRSKSFLKPLADCFQKKECHDGTAFGIERVGDGDSKCMRAYVERTSGGESCKFFLDVVWQETWSSIWSRTSWVQGKLVYQKEFDSEQFFARQYSIVNNKITLFDQEEPSHEGILPGDFIKELAA